MVPIMLRFQERRRACLADRCSSGKFCRLRAPIWKMSVYFPTSGTASGDITSVMMGSPVASHALGQQHPALLRPVPETRRAMIRA